jgi:hypothetical protein
MRRLFKTAITWTAAAVVITALSGSSLSVSSVSPSPVVATKAWVWPKFVPTSPVLTDAERIRAEVPELAASRAQVAAAEAAAAAAAAAQAAAEAAAQAAAAARARAVTTAASSGRTINVWTYGYQDQINACRGGVDMTARYGMRIVGEHWSCGGSAFPTAAGSIVRFTGIDAGTYRVIGVVAVLDAYTALTSQVPHGYAMLYQTCRGGDSHYTEFVALQQIG